MTKPSSLPPSMVRLVRQSGTDTDCVVASLSSLLGTTYPQMLVYCAKVNPSVLTAGMTWKDAKKAAKLAGVKTRVVRSFDINEATGLLSVWRLKIGVKEEHAVLLWEGRICDGNGELWLHADDYCAQYGYTPTTLLVRDE